MGGSSNVSGALALVELKPKPTPIVGKFLDLDVNQNPSESGLRTGPTDFSQDPSFLTDT
jgi:hypothetical protein